MECETKGFQLKHFLSLKTENKWKQIYKLKEKITLAGLIRQAHVTAQCNAMQAWGTVYYM